MNKEQFKLLHKNINMQFSRTREYNPLPSATDPTQDVPIRMIEVNSLGEPMNVKQTKGIFSNLKPENFTAIERRNTDKFDALNELQQSAHEISSVKDIKSNYKPIKKQKKHEE